MGISKEAFEQGKKPLEKGTLEYEILEFLKSAKKTNEPARNRKEILEGLNMRPPQGKYLMDIINYNDKAQEVGFALLSLESEGMIVSKNIQGKVGFETYYMAR